MSGWRQFFSARLWVHALLLRPFIKLTLGMNISGKENLGELNRAIIIANHNSHLDILLLFNLIPLDKVLTTHAVAAKEYFDKSKVLFGLVNFLFRPIWLVRGAASKTVDPLEALKKVLDEGDNVFIFPEGTRGEPGHFADFKSGIGRLIEQYPEAPVIPVFLFGPERSFPRGTRIPVPICNEILVGPALTTQGSHLEINAALESTLKYMRASELENRHRRSKGQRKFKKSIAILGIDGSGKSTVSEKLAMRLSSTQRVIQVSDILQLFEQGDAIAMQPLLTEKIRVKLGQYAKHVKSLKRYKIPKLTELLLRDYLLDEVKKWYHPDYLVLDGSPLLNLVAWSSIYKGDSFSPEMCHKAIKVLTNEDASISRKDIIYQQYPELLMLKNLKLTHLKRPDMVVLIDLDPEVALQRISGRGKVLQVHENREKLTRLRESYLAVCDVLKNDMKINTLVTDGSLSVDEIIYDILEFHGERG